MFHKGRELYGLYEARKANRNLASEIMVVEGYMDVIALAQHGMRNAVATLGTATSEDSSGAYVPRRARRWCSVSTATRPAATGRLARAGSHAAAACSDGQAGAASCSCQKARTRTPLVRARQGTDAFPATRINQTPAAGELPSSAIWPRGLDPRISLDGQGRIMQQSPGGCPDPTSCPKARIPRS